MVLSSEVCRSIVFSKVRDVKLTLGTHFHMNIFDILCTSTEDKTLQKGGDIPEKI